MQLPIRTPRVFRSSRPLRISNSPLAQGLVGAWIMDGYGPFNVVDGQGPKSFTAGGNGFLPSATPIGPAASINGSGAGNTKPCITGLPRMAASTLGTIVTLATTNGATLGNGTTYVLGATADSSQGVGYGISGLGNATQFKFKQLFIGNSQNLGTVTNTVTPIMCLGMGYSIATTGGPSDFYYNGNFIESISFSGSSGSGNLIIGGSPAGSSQTWIGAIIATFAWTRKLAAWEHAAIAADPWQLF